MKTFLKLTGITSLALTCNSQAIERLTPIKEPKAVSPKVEKCAVAKAWLGVAGKPVNGALAAQLGIEHGVTLELVAPDGSAGKAGIKKFDVITKIGEKQIKDMHDLRSVMKSSAINDTLNVEVFSGGELKTHSVVLDAHPGNFAKQNSRRPRVRSLAQRSLSQPQSNLPQAFQLPPEMDHDRIEKIMAEQIKQMEQRVAQMQIKPADLQALKSKSMKMQFGGLSGSVESSFSSSVTVMDDEGSIQVKSSGDAGKHVEVKDNEGKVLYSGPYQTDEDKAKVPAEVRERVDALALDSGEGNFNFSFGR